MKRHPAPTASIAGMLLATSLGFQAAVATASGDAAENSTENSQEITTLLEGLDATAAGQPGETPGASAEQDLLMTPDSLRGMGTEPDEDSQYRLPKLGLPSF